MRNALLVARREYIAYVTAWGFWLGLLFTPIALGLGVILPQLAESSTPSRYYTVIDPTGELADAIDRQLAASLDEAARNLIRMNYAIQGQQEQEEAVARYRRLRTHDLSTEQALKQVLPDDVPAVLPAADYIPVTAPANDIDTLKSYLDGDALVDGPLGPRPLFAAIILKPDEGIEYWSGDLALGSLLRVTQNASRSLERHRFLSERGVDVAAFRTVDLNALKVTELSTRTRAGGGNAVTFADRAPLFAGFALCFLLWLLIFSVVNFLLTGTIEERSNKIFDALLTGVTIPQLLSGKLLGVLALSATLMSVWGLAALGLSLASAEGLPSEMRDILSAVLAPDLVIPAVISFFIGYLMYGAIFLALGSLCDTIQEAQSLMSPIIIVMLLPLVVMAITIGNPSSPLLQALVWVPLFTPFLLILRIPLDPPLWQVAGPILMMVVFTLGTLWLSARIYRAGAVHGAGASDVKRFFGGLLGRKPKT